MSPSKPRYWRLVSVYIWHKGQSYRVDRLTRDTLLEILPSLEKKRHRWPAGDKTWQAGWDYAVLLFCADVLAEYPAGTMVRAVRREAVERMEAGYLSGEIPTDPRITFNASELKALEKMRERREQGKELS